MTQIIEINHHWSDYQFNCPVCGASIITDSARALEKTCDHHLFSWQDLDGEYYAVHPLIENAFQKHGDQIILSPFEEPMFQEMPEHTVFFCFRKDRFSCGPVSQTLVHGIRYLEPSKKN